ncbi:MAG: hypothetical protein NC254_03780 [bacterium]|nr:hypothetical protein [bacterium]
MADNKKGGEIMNIQKQSAEEHTVMGYVDVCACAMPRAMCGCSVQVCACACGDDNERVSESVKKYNSINSPSIVQANNSAQAKMNH